MTIICLILATLLFFVISLLGAAGEMGGGLLLGLARMPVKKSKVPTIFLILSIILAAYTIIYTLHSHIRFI
jgi:hypothetical protein